MSPAEGNELLRLTVEAVLFDWGGTLSQHVPVDLLDMWRAAARVLAPEDPEPVAQALLEAETHWWQTSVAAGDRSGTTEQLVRSVARETHLDVAGRAAGVPRRVGRDGGARPGCGPRPEGAARARPEDRAAVEHALAARPARALARRGRPAGAPRRAALHQRHAAHEAAPGGVPRAAVGARRRGGASGLRRRPAARRRQRRAGRRHAHRAHDRPSGRGLGRRARTPSW